MPVDVRELPVSRKKGFSKSAFLRRLVNPSHCLSARPRPGLPQAHPHPIQGRWQLANLHAGFFEAHPDARCPLRELVNIAQATPACLVCFEADYSTCHRTYVARAARQLGGPTVMHLTAKTALPDLDFQQAA